MSISVEVKGLEKLQAVLKQAPERIQSGFDKAVSEVSNKILATAKGLIKSKTGWLRDSGYVVQRGPVQYEVGFGASYARFVHEGTKPHLIYPRALGGVLRFETGGQIVFTRGPVHHPGTMPQNYLTGALEYHRAELLTIIRDNVKKWLAME